MPDSWEELYPQRAGKLSSLGRAGSCLLALLLVGATSLQARDEIRPVAEIPFETRDGLMWVKVTVPRSAAPLNFLIDTGASASVINLATADELKLKRGEHIAVRGVHSLVPGYWPTHFTASLQGVALPKDCLALDLNELSRVTRHPVDGLLGMDFFRQRVVQIDYTAHVMRVLKSSPDSTGEIVPLKVESRAMLLPVSVNESGTRWVRLDTGCASALQWVTTETAPQTASSQAAVGLAATAFPLVPTTVRIGKSEFRRVITGLHQNEIFAGESGLLGNGLLSRFSKVTLDARAGHLILE